MSISQVQKETQFSASVYKLFSDGTKPTFSEIARDAQLFFSKHPIGNPYPVDSNIFIDGLKSDVKAFNSMAMLTILNFSVLYQAAYIQAASLSNLRETLQSRVEKITKRQRALESQINDFLLSIYNSDGYFYSFSDTFNDILNTDLTLTSSHVDTKHGVVSIPGVAIGSKRLSSKDIASIQYQAYKIAKGAPTITLNSNATIGAVSSPVSSQLGAEVKAVGYGAIADSLDDDTTNYWYTKVTVQEEKPLALVVNINLNTSSGKQDITKIVGSVCGIKSTSLIVYTSTVGKDGKRSFRNFGREIESTLNRFSFMDSHKSVSSIQIVLRKSKADETLVRNGTKFYVYHFGFKELSIIKENYDLSSRFVSKPVSIPAEITNAHIDAVSLVADYSAPQNTYIDFYVAADDDTATYLDDFAWRKITPLSSTDEGATIVKFDGANQRSTYIRSVPKPGELQLIPINTNTTDKSKLNPLDTIAPIGDVYLICNFDDEPILETMKIEEGINTASVYHRPLSSRAISEGLSYWAPLLNDSSTKKAGIDIESGRGFFYGSLIGENGRSVYVETKIQVDEEQDTSLKEVRKSDDNSLYWDVNVYLNGNLLAQLPSGTKSKTIPWKFQAGLNHISMVINIPAATSSLPYPYLGAIDIMHEANLSDYGIVKLADWSYVDIFKLRYNETGMPNTFSIFNGKIVSRKKPTNNLRLTYTKPTGFAPSAVRFRCDMRRSTQNSSITPLLRSYRLRFAYGDDTNG